MFAWMLAATLSATASVTVADSGAVPVTNLTLAAVTETALRENEQLKSLRAKWEAMRERPVQAGALPNPMLSYSGMDMAEGGDWPDTNEKRVMLQQAFPWFGKRKLRERIAAKDAEAMEHELEAMSREITMQVKESYYDLYAEQQVIAITRQEALVLQRLAETAQTLYATGTREQTDLIQAQTEVTMLSQNLLERLARETTLKARLNTLLNRRADAPLPALEKPPEPVASAEAATLFEQAAADSPEVRAAQSQVERFELERRLMAKEAAPDYRLGLEYRDFRDNDSMMMFTVSVDLPIWFEKNKAGVREAEKMRQSSEAAREAAKRENAFDVQDAHFRLDTSRRMLALIRRELIPQAEARLNAHEAAYRTGKADFMDLLESERFLLETKLMAVRTEAEIGMQAARLERAVGMLPSRKEPPLKTFDEKR
jgi:outer membrane protein TolC